VTWLLLTHRGANGISVELSLPELIGEDDRVVAWKERIILPPIRRDSTPGAAVLDQGEAIEVEITRRTP
jgi:hypothetical protein